MRDKVVGLLGCITEFVLNILIIAFPVVVEYS